jgi:hypothetical protein
MAVPNRGFEKSNFQFKLIETARAVKKEWTEVLPETDTEHQMKSSLHKGLYKDLNIYLTTCRNPGNNEAILGCAYAIFQF